MLRDYQIKAIEDQLKKNLIEVKNGASFKCLPGKETFVFCELAKRFFLTEIKKVLILFIGKNY